MVVLEAPIHSPGTGWDDPATTRVLKAPVHSLGTENAAIAVSRTLKAPVRSLETGEAATTGTVVLKAPVRSTLRGLLRASLAHCVRSLQCLRRPRGIERTAPFSPPRRGHEPPQPTAVLTSLRSHGSLRSPFEHSSASLRSADRSLRSSSLARCVAARRPRQRAPRPIPRGREARACASRRPRNPGKGRPAVRVGMKGAARSIHPGRCKHRKERSD